MKDSKWIVRMFFVYCFGFNLLILPFMHEHFVNHENIIFHQLLFFVNNKIWSKCDTFIRSLVMAYDMKRIRKHLCWLEIRNMNKNNIFYQILEYFTRSYFILKQISKSFTCRTSNISFHIISNVHFIHWLWKIVELWRRIQVPAMKK